MEDISALCHTKQLSGRGALVEVGAEDWSSKRRPVRKHGPQCWDEPAMRTEATSGKESSEGRTDLQITVCSNGVINVHNPDGEHGTHSVMLDAESNVIRCSCKGHHFHGHCYHVDEIESRPLVFSAASCAAQSKKVATDGGQDEPRCDDRFRLPEDPKHVTEDEYDDDSGVTDVHGCSTCSGFAHGDNEQCATCRQRNVSPVDETPL